MRAFRRTCVALAIIACVLCAAAVQAANTCQSDTKWQLELGSAGTGTRWASQTVAIVPAPTGLTTTSLLITNKNNKDQQSAAYTSEQYRAVNGFKVTFSFEVKAATQAEGFAFVLQSISPISAGGSSANLGYAFAKSFAIEFDMFSNPTAISPDTPGNNHVEVHTLYNSASPNSPSSNSPARIAGNTFNPGVDMKSAGKKDVVIEYIAAASQISVKIGTGTKILTSVNPDLIASMFPNGLAYFGFTGATSQIAADIEITNFNIFTVPVDPAQATVTTVPSMIAANTFPATPQSRVQLNDACGSPLTVSQGVSAVSATLTVTNGGQAVRVDDQGNGQYWIYVWADKAALPSSSLPFAVFFTFPGKTAKIPTGSPATSNIANTPGAPNGPTSTTDVPLASLSTFVAGVTRSVTVTVRDALSNPTRLGAGYNIQAGFPADSPTLGTFTSSISNPEIVVVSLRSTVKATGTSIAIRVHNDNLAPDRDVIGSPVTVDVNAEQASGTNSDLTSTNGGLSSIPVNTVALITLRVKDQFNNPAPGDASTMTNAPTCALVWVTPQAGTAPTTNPSCNVTWAGAATGNEWNVRWQTAKAGSYNVVVRVNNVQLSGAYNVVVTPGAPTRADILTAPADGKAGSVSTFNLVMYDKDGNARSSANSPTTEALSVTLTPTAGSGGAAATFTCGSSTAFVATTTLTTFTCAVSATLAGQYVVSFNPRIATTYVISYAITGVSPVTPINTANDQVVVGAGPAVASSSSITNANPTQSGVLTTYTVTIRDQFNNIRAGTDEKSTIAAQLTVTLNGVTTTVPCTVASSTTGIYSVSYTPKLAATYANDVRINTIAVTTGAVSIVVSPGIVSPVDSLITGSGILQGVATMSATFRIQARDKNLNNLLATPVVPFTVSIAGAGSPTTAGTVAATAGVPGSYTVTYTVPIYNTNDRTYTITVLSGTPAEGVGKVGGVYTAQNQQAAGVASKAEIPATGTGSIQPGTANVPLSFWINDRDASGPVLDGNSEQFFTAEFTGQGPIASIPMAQVAGTCPAGGQKCVPRIITWTPKQMGTYKITIKGNGGVETEKSAAPGYTIVIGPGVMSPPNTVLSGTSTVATAGVPFTFKAQLADAAGNLLTTTAPAGTSLTFPSTTVYEAASAVLASPGIYTITLTFKLAGQQPVYPLVNGVAPTVPFTVVVAPGAVAGQISSWQGIPVRVVAGQQSAAIELQLRDKYSNALTNGLTLNCSLTVQNQPPSMVQSIRQPNANSNSYILTFTPTKSDYLNLLAISISCGSIKITSIPFDATPSRPQNPPTVQVIPAAVSGAQSVSQPPATATAGKELTYKLALKDGLGNPWRSFETTSSSRASLIVSVSASITWKNLAIVNVPATVALDPSAPGEGIYIVKYTPIYASPGDYSWTFQAEGVNFSPVGSTQKTTVNADVPFMPYAQLESNGATSKPGGANIPAGAPGGLTTIQLRDRNLNPVTVAEDPSVLTLSFYQKNGGTFCVPDSPVVGSKDLSQAVVPQTATVTAVAGSPGKYSITWTINTVGTYWFDVTYGVALPGQPTNTFIGDCVTQPGSCSALFPAAYPRPNTCDQIASTSAFTITAGVVDPRRSLLWPLDDQGRVDTGSAGSGDRQEFNVTLRDRFDNNVTLTEAMRSHTLTFGATCTGGTATATLSPTTNQMSFVAPSLSQEHFTVRFVVGSSQLYRVPLLIDTLVPTQSGACPEVFVGPAGTFYIKLVPTNPARDTTAGIAANYTLITTDKYNNEVKLSVGETPIYNVTFSRNAPDAPYIVWNTSVVTTSFTFPQVAISFLTDGMFNVTITQLTLVKQNPEDKTRVPTWPTKRLPLSTDPLSPEPRKDDDEQSVPVASAVCASNNTKTPYRCFNNKKCVDNYLKCTDYSTPPATCNFMCPTGECVATFAECSDMCTGGADFCPIGKLGDGFCSMPTTVGGESRSTCPSFGNVGFCPAPYKPCPTGVCRLNLADCPSTIVCPPYTSICPDGRSCMANAKDCPPIPNNLCTDPRLPFQCRDFSCVSRAENCPTDRSCGGLLKLCPDQTCKASAAECTETYSCLFGQIKCPNGECRANFYDCPSTVVCGSGQVRCENGGCAASVDKCSSLIIPCPDGVRCADGTCRRNMNLCPTSVSCSADKPVLCFDKSCVDDVSQCGAPRQCAAPTPVLCPDGSCVGYITSCPTTPTCPVELPTRCEDGTCVAQDRHCRRTATDGIFSCPPQKPYRCPDSTCVGNWKYCPTKQLSCNADYPVLCPDHSCVSAPEMCSETSALPCPPGLVRCPNGGCALAKSFCPTRVTCGPGLLPNVTYVRGTDGACRRELDPNAPVGNTTSRLTFSSGQTAFCGGGVRCPQSSTGEKCAPNLSECPQDQTCPSSRPVRCSDSSCAQSLEDCPIVLEVENTRTVCAAGSTTSSAGECLLSTSCPEYAQVKCWDESCRISPDDCPVPTACPANKPYLCGAKGRCMPDANSCTLSECSVKSMPVKCPWVNQCAQNVTSCPNIFTTYTDASTGCPTRRCRDGRCADSDDACSLLNLQCPPQTPYACRDGLCVGFPDECNNPTNGCPYYAQLKCADGQCVSDYAHCAYKPSYPTFNNTQCPFNETSGSFLPRCADGSCPGMSPGQKCPDLPTGCRVGQDLCIDGTCAANKTGQTDISGCVHGVVLPGLIHNTCPPWRPYRCADGYCTVSSIMCPIIPYSLDMTAPSDPKIKCTGFNCLEVPMTGSRRSAQGIGGNALLKLTFRCADASLVADSSQCPTLKPCPSKTIRCPNGQCRADRCPAYDKCMLRFPHVGSQVGVMCAETGHCAPESSLCMDNVESITNVETGGCPQVTPYKCPSGRCMLNKLECAAEPRADACSATFGRCPSGVCADAADGSCPMPNGCDSTAPFLCVDGSCRADFSTCPTGAITDDCPANGVRCPNGRCVSDFRQCPLSNGCTVGNPILCANGECKAVRSTVENVKDGVTDTCPPVVVCDPGHVLCADQTCVAHQSLCRPLWPCPSAAPNSCKDKSGKAAVNAVLFCQPGTGSSLTNNTCPPVGCPALTPVLCSDGRCVTSVGHCVERTQPACIDPAAPVRCLDGSCQASTLDCAKLAHELNNAPATRGIFSINQNLDNSTCLDRQGFMCPDGSCASKASQCSFVAACPHSMPKRCWDGTCVNGTSFQDCKTPVEECMSGRRCEDGTCRSVCLPIAGCPLDTPYACIGRLESCTKDRETCLGMKPGRRRLLQTTTDSTDYHIQETCVDCMNALIAPVQTVVLAPTVDTSIDVAFDASGVPRASLVVPGGAFQSPAATITIEGVPPSTLPCFSKSGSNCRTDLGQFIYSNSILSAPFRFKVDTDIPNRAFQGRIVVNAMIDNQLYDAVSEAARARGEIPKAEVPCEMQGASFSVTPNSLIYTPDLPVKYTCTGSLHLGAERMSMRMDPACDAIDIEGVYNSETSLSLSSWNFELSRQCLCFNIERSTPSNPQPLPIYSRRNGTETGAWSRYEVGKQVCIFVERSSVTGYTASLFTIPDMADGACASTPSRLPNALYFKLSKNDMTDQCGNRGIGGKIAPDSVCLATLTPDRSGWRCLLSTRAERLAAKTWEVTSGRPQRRVTGTVSTDAHPVLAFAYIPLPPEPVPEEEECDLWCQYKWVIIGCIIGIGGFLLFSAYAISRLKRYRDKYKENQKNLHELKERAREIDEFAGGLGIADEDVDMMANPMVIEMKKLDQQLIEVNMQLDTQAEKDAAKIDALAQDRERLHAELTRIKALMAQQQKQSATRMEDIHVSQPHYSAAAAGARGPTSPSALVPMEMEMPAREEPGSQRQQFGQVRRPNKNRE